MIYFQAASKQQVIIAEKTDDMICVSVKNMGKMQVIKLKNFMCRRVGAWRDRHVGERIYVAFGIKGDSGFWYAVKPK